VVFVAVVRTLSSSSGGRSATEGASDAIVYVDCIESLEALEALGFLLFADFFGVFVVSWCSVMRVKKAQSGERL